MNDKVVLSFKDALLDMLKTKPLQNITVSSLTDRAMIARSTFYVYYDDIFSLYDEMIEEHLDFVIPFVREGDGPDSPSPVDSLGNIGKIYEMLCADRKFFQILLGSNEAYFNYRFRQRIVSAMRNANEKALFPDYVYAIFADRYIDIVKSWILQDRFFPADLMSRIINIWAGQFVPFPADDLGPEVQEYENAVLWLKENKAGVYTSIFGQRGSSRNRIKESFIEVFMKNPYGSISATDIIRSAGVSRSTFYKYFSNVDALYENLCTAFIESQEQLFWENEFSYQDFILKISAVLFEYIDIFYALLFQSNSNFFRSKFLDFMKNAQMHYFGMTQEEILHENIAKTWLDFYEIFSHGEVASKKYHGVIIFRRCQAICETFDYCNRFYSLRPPFSKDVS